MQEPGGWAESGGPGPSCAGPAPGPGGLRPGNPPRALPVDQLKAWGLGQWGQGHRLLRQVGSCRVAGVIILSKLTWLFLP